MLFKITKVFKNPKTILSVLIWHWHEFLLSQRRRNVKRVEKNGEIFYKYRGVLYPEFLNKGNACQFILSKANQYCKGKGIDVGADAWPLAGAIPILNETCQNAYKLDNFPDNSLDYVFSSHCLEHLDRWQEALKLWIRKLKQQGVLFLYLPHKSMRLWNPGGPWVGYNHQWVPTAKVLKEFLETNGMKAIDYNSEKDKFWSFHMVFVKQP